MLKNVSYRILILSVVLVFTGLAATAQATPPRLFFSDLVSGPNSGGESVSGSSGAYVTLYGNNFGTTQGASTVTMNGSNCMRVVSWGIAWRWYQKVVVQLGSSCSSGNIIVTTSSGSSNAIPFAVRSGNIRCVSTTGSDSNGGTFPSSCWRSIAHAVHTIAPGDIAYVLDGVSQTATDDYACDIAIESGSSSAATPMALVAYPGATATIGSTSAGCALRIPAIGGVHDNWVLAGMTLRGNGAIDLDGPANWYIVGNDLSCPGGSGQAACLHTDSGNNVIVNGNYVHNVGDTAGSIDKYFHAVYYTTNSNHIFMGWNEVAPNPNAVTNSGGCRAVQFYSTGGSDQFDLHVHDNLIHDAICDGINFSTVNPGSGGTVEAYNNVIYHVGTGPDPANGSSEYSCLVAGGGGSVPVLAYNNTMYDCGSRRNSDSGALYVARPLTVYNNVIQQVTGEAFFATSGPGSLSGSNNVWFGVSGAPSLTAANITADPLLVSPSTRNFNLQTSSPAIGAALTSQATSMDIAGLIRPTPPSIGAHEGGSGGTQGPNPPTNLSVTVQ